MNTFSWFTAALPVTFKRELQNEVTKESGQAVFSCELSKPNAQVDWRKGRVILKPDEKYEMKQEGRFVKLLIHNVEASDAGNYSCKTKDSESTAELFVKGKACRLLLGRFGTKSFLACFCEVALCFNVGFCFAVL